MNINRRKFLKGSLCGAGVAFAGNFIGCTSTNASNSEIESALKKNIEKGINRKQQFNMCGYAADPIPVVRIGYVGLGGRGSWAVTRMLNIQEIEITGLCDILEDAVKTNQETLKKCNRQPAKEFFGDEYAYKKLCEQDDIDLIYIATSWQWHTPIALYAMECGKHVAVEVPAAKTLEECWQLVETSERTKRHCMQLENCCYDFFEIMTVNMAQKGLFGEIIHGEGAYIHELLIGGMFGKPEKPTWRWDENHKSGNPYPTHGLGPVCWAMNINRGDKMEYLTSMSTNDFTMKAHVEELAKKDDFYKPMAQMSYRGNLNMTSVRTTKGKTILIQHDVSTPHPYNRLHVLTGTKGSCQKYPEPAKISFGHNYISPEKLQELTDLYTPEIVKHISEVAKIIGGHGGMDFIMDWRMIDCLRNGLPLDMDVYDAAAWSAITPLSYWSVANRSNSIDIPDFTGGSWQTNNPVDLTLRGGGNTNIKRKEE